MKRKRRPGAADQYTAARRRHMKWLTAVICMAVLVAFGTVYGLMMPATAMEGETYCGMTEHTHSASCYSSELTCGLAQDGTHVHDASCYTEVLTCQIPEHTHSESCYVNPNETQSQSGTQTGDTTVSSGTQNGSTTTSSGTQDTASPSGTAAGDNGVISGNGEAGNGSGTGDVTGTGDNGVSGDTGNTGNAGDANSTDVTGNGDDIDETGESETTVDTEETQPESMDAEPVEAAALPSGAQIPEGYTQQYTVRDEVNGFAVTVYAPEGVVPEGAVLTAQMLNVGDAAYTAAEQELDAEVKAALAEDGVSALSADEAAAAGTDTSEAAEPDYGFAALDIHFEDANGNEVEPNGNVYVSIDAAGLLPEDADPETVTVQHHAEQANGDVTVETVADAADATDGVVEVVESNANAGTAGDVQAAFAVSGFSTFTIVWNGNHDLTVQIIDTEGNPIGGDASIGGDSISEVTSIEDIVDMIAENGSNNVLSGYTFSRAVVSNNANNAVNVGSTGYVQRILYDDDYYDIPILGGFGTWVYSTNTSGNDDWSPITSLRNWDNKLYLIYEKDSTPGGGTGGTVIENATVATGKTAVLRDEDTGNYDLTLSVSGDQGTSENPAKVDILLVVDKSGSMAYDLGGEEGNDRERMKAVVNAVQSLTGALEGNTKVDVQYNLITFSSLGYTESDRDTGWTTDASVINSAVSYFIQVNNGGKFAHDLEGGTNYQYAFNKAKAALNNNAVRADAQQIVIFLTDGIPTHQGIWRENRDDANTGFTNTNAAIGELSGLNADAFYAIGIGNVFTGNSQNSPTNGKTNLNMIVSAVQNNNIDATLYTTQSSSELEEIFKEIAGSTTFFAAENVVMSDTLSEYADIVVDTDGTVKFTVTLEKQQSDNGEYTNVGSEVVISGNSASFTTDDTTVYITPTYDAKTIQVTLTGPNNTTYALAPDYRYSVTTVITPSEAAIKAGMGSDAAKQTPNSGTGTHADNNELGFWSNDNDKAKVTFTANGQDGSEPFPKPVIQVKEPTTGDLTITKEISEATVTEEKDYSFTISTQLPAVAGQNYSIDGEETVTFSGTTDTYGNYTATVTISAVSNPDSVDGSVTIIGLPVGKYTVTENTNNTSIDGYRFDRVTYAVGNDTFADSATVELTGTEGENATVAVTNSYTALEDITIHKTDSDNNELNGAQFQLYYLEKDVKYYYCEKTVGDATTVSWEPEGAGDPTTLTSSDDGRGGRGLLIFQKLDTGKTYYLVETKAPDGYQLLEKEIQISWLDGKLRANYSGGSYDLVEKGTGYIKVTNITGTILPETGGAGTTYMTIGGLLLIAAAVGGGYGLRRRFREEGN